MTASVPACPGGVPELWCRCSFAEHEPGTWTSTSLPRTWREMPFVLLGRAVRWSIPPRAAGGGSGEQRGKTESNSKDPARKQRYYPPRSRVRSILLPQTRREECFEPTCNRGQICSTAREGKLAKGDTNAKLQGMCALVGVVLARKSIEHSGSVARRDLYVMEAILQRAQASTVVAIFY